MRAARVLREVDVIVCERPSHTLKLLNHFDIHGKQLVSYTEANKNQAIQKIVSLLEHSSCAFVVDAGTPGISDPGSELVAAVRKAGCTIQMVPGPSALTSAIALTGERIQDFRFVGFFPYKQKERRALLDWLSVKNQYVIAYEAPHRIEKTISFLAQEYPEYHIILVSEISKLHEKIIAGTAMDIQNEFARDANMKKGEFVLFIRKQNN